MGQKIFIAGQENSVFNQILFEIRSEEIQKDRQKFRLNLEKAGELLAYEISKALDYSPKEVTTPLGTLTMELCQEWPVIVSIMRAGVPLHNGVLRMLDHADNGFISAYRHHTQSNKFIIKVEYVATPDVVGRDVVLVDPMIATGKSIELAYESIVQQAGKPERVFVAGLIASEEGLDHVQSCIPDVRIYVGAVDGELTAKSYIVPGLGDAGDLAFGEKNKD